jgi:hypothetical protein
MNTIPCVYVATMKGCDYGEKCRNAHYVNSKVEEPEVVEVPIAKVEELVIVKPTEPEPVIKKVEEPIKAEAAVPKKDKKKEYKKRKWLEAKMAEEAKLAEEKRIAEEKAEKNRQKKERKRARQAEELAKGPEPPKPEPTPEVREPTEEELIKMIKRKMLKEKLEDMKFYRVMLMHEHKPGNFKFMHVGSK